MSERFIIEFACGGLVFAGSLLLTQVFHFSPIIASAKGFSAVTQSLLFASLPMAIYLMSRLYFTGVLTALEAAMGNIPLKFSNWSTMIWRLAAFVVMYVGVQIVKVAFPSSIVVISEMWTDAVGKLPTMVMDHTKTERTKFFERGQKFFWLIVAWFTFFFIFELALRGIIFGISKAVKATMPKDSAVIEKNEDPAVVNEVHANDDEPTEETEIKD
jgi:hypothetical protein